MRHDFKRRAPRLGFTLIELLVVVAIMSILASLALPNFLEAQTRSRTARVKADMRTLKIGVDCYCADHGQYPTDYGTDEMSSWALLTTPIAYLSTIPDDAFSMRNSPQGRASGPDLYCCPATLNHSDWASDAEGAGFGYGIVSPGPDGFFQWASSTPEPYYWKWLTREGAADNSLLYDPTNGTISLGDMVTTNEGILNN
jgi:prepilin-type N-terminal cleavage/methylation domain-containing protein